MGWGAADKPATHTAVRVDLPSVDMAGVNQLSVMKGLKPTAVGAAPLRNSHRRERSCGARRRVAVTATARHHHTSHPLPTRRGLLSSALAAAGLCSLAQGAIDTPPARAASVFEGEYSDPKHPGCLRRVESDGRVVGADGTPGCLNGEPQKEWALQGVIDDQNKRIFIDFSPKGGPKDLVGVYSDGGIMFPDGNLWSKKQ